MEDMLLEFENGIADILELFSKVRDGIGNKPVSKDIRDYIEMFMGNYEAYKISLDGSSLEKIAESAKSVCIYGAAFGQNLKKIDVDEETKILANKLENSSYELRKIIENSPILTVSLSDEARIQITSDMQDYKSFKKQLRETNKEFEKHQHKITNSLAENESQAKWLKKEIESLEEIYKSKIGAISLAYEEQLKAINNKNDQLDTLLGNAASRVIVTEYADSADQEKIAADWLRGGSLFCMAIIIVIAGYSFWESIHQSFDLSNSLLRLALVFLLSVPAAYLARESTKHRQQQYTHLQTSLDLKAINPYIASLPDEEQHKIKSEIAQRIFAPKDFQSISNESYPINSQEVIMALISKFGNDKDKQTD